MTKRDRNMAIAWLVLFGLSVVAFLGVCDATEWKYGIVDKIIDTEYTHAYAIDGQIDEYYLKTRLLTDKFDGITAIFPEYKEDMRQTWVIIECWEGCDWDFIDPAIAAEIGLAKKRWAEGQE